MSFLYSDIMLLNNKNQLLNFKYQSPKSKKFEINPFGNLKLEFICYLVFEIWIFIPCVFAVKITVICQLNRSAGQTIG